MSGLGFRVAAACLGSLLSCLSVAAAPAPPVASVNAGEISWLAAPARPSVAQAAAPAVPATDRMFSSLDAYLEDFEDGLAQGWLPDLPADWTISNGQYHAQLQTASAEVQTLVSAFTLQTLSDTVYSVDIDATQTAYAVYLICRGSAGIDPYPAATGNGYMFGYDGTQWSIWRLDGGNPVNLAAWTESAALVDGVNRLTMAATGAEIVCLINEVEVARFTDATYSSGHCGLLGFSETTTNIVHFDNVSLTNVAALSITADTTAISETPGDGIGIFTVSRFGPTTEAVTARVQVSGTAITGTDYQLTLTFVALATPPPLTLTIPAGQNSVAISVTVLADSLMEAPESITFSLLPDPAYAVSSPSSATIWLYDDAPLTVYTLTMHQTRYGNAAQSVLNTGGYLVLDRARQLATAIHTQGKTFHSNAWDHAGLTHELGCFPLAKTEWLASMTITKGVVPAPATMSVRLLTGTRAKVKLGSKTWSLAKTFTGHYYLANPADDLATIGTISARLSSKESAAAIGQDLATVVARLEAALVAKKYVKDPPAVGLPARVANAEDDHHEVLVFGGTARDPAWRRGLKGLKSAKDYLVVDPDQHLVYAVESFTMGKAKHYRVVPWHLNHQGFKVGSALPKGKEYGVLALLGTQGQDCGLADYSLVFMSGLLNREVISGEDDMKAPSTLRGYYFSGPGGSLEKLAWRLTLDLKASQAANREGRLAEDEVERLLQSLRDQGYVEYGP